MRAVDVAASDPQRYKAWLNVRYGCVLNRLNARLYGHLATSLNAVQIIAGTGAVAAALKQYEGWSIAIGVIVAIVGAVGVVLDPAGRAARFDLHSRRYGEIDELAHALPIEELEGRLAKLQNDPPPGEIAALEDTAYNRNLIQNGRADAVVATTVFEGFVARFA